jgi:DNA-directed RNA polymerase specialized sigma24 family protein
MTESDDWTNDEVRLADLLEQGLQRLLAWARAIAKNFLRDFLKVRPPTRGPLLPGPLRLRPENFVRVAGALEKLPKRYRKVIEARLFDRLAPRVIADRLGWPQVRVRVYSKRAVQLLASQLRGKS